MWPSGTRGNSINASDKQVTGVPLLPTPSPWATTAAKKKTTTAHTFQEKGLNKSSGVHGFSQLLRRRVDTEGIVGYGSQGTWYRICGIDQGGGVEGMEGTVHIRLYFPQRRLMNPLRSGRAPWAEQLQWNFCHFTMQLFLVFSGEYREAVLLWCSRNVSIMKLHPTTWWRWLNFHFFGGGGDCSFNKESRVWRKHHI